MKRLILISILFIVCGSVVAQKPIVADVLRSHVEVLAHDSLTGRRAATEGGAKARAYIAEQLAEASHHVTYDTLDFELRAKGLKTPMPVTAVNVWTEIEGTDPKLRAEKIVLLAHYDHIGEHNGEVYNGANDNASSVAVLMELARVIGPQRRSMVILFTDAEEMGLHGSADFVKRHCADSSVAMAINLEMLGKYNLVGTMDYATSLATTAKDSLLSMATLPDGLKTRHETKSKLFINASDARSFVSRGIPVLVFYTSSFENYHKPTDDASTLDYEGMEQIAQYVASVVKVVGNMDQLPRETNTEKK